MKKLLFLISSQASKKSVYSLIATIFFILLASICSTTLPILLKNIANSLTTKQNSVSIHFLLFSYFSLMLLEKLFNEIQFCIYSVWENSIIQNIFSKIFDKLFLNHKIFFIDTLPGSITRKIYQAISGIDALMFDCIFKITPLIIRFIFIFLSIAINFDIKLSIILGIIIAAYYYFMHKINNKLLSHQHSIRNTYINAEGLTTDLISAWKDIKLANAYIFAKNILTRKIEKIAEKTFYFYKKRSIYGFLQSLPICFVYLIINYLIIKYNQNNEAASTGNILLINNYLFLILTPLESFSLIFRNTAKNYSDALLIEEILTFQKEDVSFIPLLQNNFSINKITINNLSIKNILNKVNLIINKGEKIAIIGQSGTGKTTFLNTLVGLQTEYDGNIFIDDINIKNIPPHHLRSYFGYLTSDAKIINETIVNNLALGNEKDISSVLQQSLISKKIQTLVNGENTLISENSSILSSGERQRLKIARILLLQRQIELYDEATSFLDYKNEKEIITNILFDPNKTVIFSTHKQDFLDKFDKVYKIQNGKLEELYDNRKIAS